MKNRNLFITTGLALALGLGTVFTAGISKNSEFNEVKADSSAVTIQYNQWSTHTFFIDMTEFHYWVDASDTEYFAVYFFNGSGNAWSEVRPVEQAKGSYILSFEMPQLNSKNVEWTTAIAVRLNSSSQSFEDKHNQTGNIDISSGNYNAIKITGWNTGVASTVQYGVDSGTTVYVNYNNATWWNDGDGTDNFNYMYFYHPLSGEASGVWSSAKMTVVNGTNDKILECIVPGNGQTYAAMIAVRCKTNTGSWGDNNSNVNNQSPDLHVAATEATKVRNAMTVYDNNAWDTNLYSYNISDNQRAIFWGTNFLSEITCGGETGANAGTITSQASAWNNVEAQYSNASLAVQGIILTKTGALVGSDDLETAVYRYDYIVFYKKGLDSTTYASYTDFIGRGNSGSGKTTSFNKPIIEPIINESNFVDNTVIVIAAISIMTLAIFGGYFLLRKKEI